MINPTTANGISVSDLLSGNDLKKDRLFKLIAGGDILLMAGAGLSMMVGLPSWDGLIQRLEKEVLDRNPQFVTQQGSETRIEYTNRLVTALGQHFFDLISDIFGEDLAPKDTHKSLVKLPFKAILTTNYDRLLVASVTQVYESSNGPVVFSTSASMRETAKFLQGINDANSKAPRVIHLHGICDNQDSIILSATHYEAKYGIKILNVATDSEPSKIQDNSWPFLRKIMWALMATRRILYVGFSMSDDYFKIMHEIVTEDARQSGIGMHYLLQRVSTSDDLAALREQAKFFKMKYGIETVYFEDNDSYTGLPNLIEEMTEKVGLIKSGSDRGFVSTMTVSAPEVDHSGMDGNMKDFIMLSKRLQQDDD